MKRCSTEGYEKQGVREEQNELGQLVSSNG